MKFDLSRAIELKNEVQDKVLVQSEQYEALLLNFCTGLGKSLSAIKIVNTRPNEPWLIVIDKLVQIKNFQDEFIKHGYEHLLNNVTFSTYRSIHKHIGNVENVVLDEGHHITSKVRDKIAEGGPLKKMVILSATIKRDKNDMYSILAASKGMKYRKLDYPISLAIENGLIPSPKITVVKIPISTSNFIKYRKLEKIAKKAAGRFMGTRREGDRVVWMRKALDLKEFVASCKIEHAKKISESNGFKGKRRIIFTNSIENAKDLGSDLAVHSDRSDNDEIIQKFNDGETDAIYCVRILQESINLNLIQLGLLTQMDNQTKSTTQQLGRVLRANDPEFFVLMVDVPLDRKYVNNNLEPLVGEFMNIRNYEEVIKELEKEVVYESNN